MNYEEKAKIIRQKTIDMIYSAQHGHIGGSLSCVDILVALYYSALKNGDKFILSKGHACMPLYFILADKGYFKENEIANFEGHPNIKIPGIVATTGSLGHGLGIGCGLAMTTKNSIFVLMGDGECQEGSVWEAAMFASHHKLNNLVGIIDYNRLGATDIVNLDPLATKWRAFDWEVVKVDGHSMTQLIFALTINIIKPLMIIANTVKGKGVSYMEGRIEWHNKVIKERVMF